MDTTPTGPERRLIVVSGQNAQVAGREIPAGKVIDGIHRFAARNRPNGGEAS